MSCHWITRPSAPTSLSSILKAKAATFTQAESAIALAWPLCRAKKRRKGLISEALQTRTRMIHDRMPVLLDKADFKPWLNGAAGAELLKPAAEDHLRIWPVSRRVNKTGRGGDDPTLIDEVAA